MEASTTVAATDVGAVNDEARRADFALRVFATALFATLALVSLAMSGPLVQADEGSYLLNAAALAGKLMRGLGAGYYSGYSVLLAPGYLLFDDFSAVFHYALIVNAALLASLPFALRRILRCVAPAAGPGWQALAAAAATCQIAVLVNSQNALSENALIPAYAWMLAFGASMLQQRKRHAAVLCGALAGALFLIHPRGATMAAPVLLALSLPCLRERSLRPLVLCLWIAAALVAAAHGPLEWLAGKSSGAKMHAYSADFVFGRYASLVTWGQALFAVFGVSLYLAIASCGLIVLAAGEAGRSALTTWRQRHAECAPSAFVSLAMLAALAASILVTAVYLTPPDRVDQIIYGRYALPCFVPLLALGLTQLHRIDRSRLAVAWWVVVGVLGAIFLMGLAFHWLPHPPEDFWVHINVLDVYVPFILAGGIDWPTIGFYFCLLALPVYSVACFASPRLAALLFAAINLGVATFITVDSTLPSNEMRELGRQARNAVRDFERSTGTPICVGIAREVDGWHTVDYQNWLFDRIDPSTVVDRARCVPGIIASMTQNRPSERFRLVSTDPYRPYGLFVQKSAALDIYEAGHALPPADFPSALPEGERSAKIETSGLEEGMQLRVGESFTFEVQVTHDGGRMTWPGYFGESGMYAVRAGARIDSLDGGDPRNEFRAELPQPLKPGQSATMEMTIGPVRKPGRYTVEIGVLQEGVAWFSPTKTVTIRAVTP